MRWLVTLVTVALVAGPGGGAARRASCALSASGEALPRRPRCAAAAARCRECGHRGANTEYTYLVDDENLSIVFQDGLSYQLRCRGNVTLDNPALPRFEPEVPVLHVVLQGCAPSPAGTVAAALHALGVRALEKLTLSGPQAGEGGALVLQRAHLAGLGALSQLVLDGGVLLTRDALADLTNLTTLYVDGDGVKPSDRDDDALMTLPTSLTRLTLVRVGSPSKSVIERLVKLVFLVVRDTVAVNLKSVAPALTSLMVESSASDVGDELSPALVNLTLWKWAPERPERPGAWQQCAGLERLTVRISAVRALPPGWLERCPRLLVLNFSSAPNLTELAPATLRGTKELRELRIVGCALRELPDELLYNSNNLIIVDFSHNALRSLSSGFFAKTKSLHTLVLSHNQLTTVMYQTLGGVTWLRELRLDYNPALGAACTGEVYALRSISSLHNLKKLTILSLRATGVTSVCRDWRDLTLLTELDLRENNMTRLVCDDLMFVGDGAVRVRLEENPIRQLQCTRSEYEASRGGLRTRATLSVPALRCDCFAYWAALVLRAAPATLDVRCEGGKPLNATSLDDLLCPDPPVPAAKRCTAAHRPHWTNGTEPRTLRVLDCSGAGLTRVPRVPTDTLWDLSLVNNSIARLDAADLPPHLRSIDVRGNLLAELDESTLAAVGAGKVSLAGNPLACHCGATASLSRLAAHRHHLDYDDLRCELSGESVRAALAATPARCASHWPLYAAAATLLGAALVIAGTLLLAPRLRARLKRALRGHAPSPRRVGPEARAWRWDAFVSFSHLDAEAAAALVAGLEARGGYRACVHSRDWRPGLPIPRQIVASVAASRVTLALVSRHFAASQWAGAEFEEALQRGAALVAVLLEPPAALPADDALRRYLSTNTYLEWGEPHFWSKLTSALGPPLASTATDEPPVVAATPPHAATDEPSIVAATPPHAATDEPSIVAATPPHAATDKPSIVAATLYAGPKTDTRRGDVAQA